MATTPAVAAAPNAAAILREQQHQEELRQERARLQAEIKKLQEQAAKEQAANPHMRNTDPQMLQPLQAQITAKQNRVDQINTYLTNHQISTAPLTVGSHGPPVHDWQTYLTNCGFKIDPNELKTSTFGASTKQAVTDYQTALKFPPNLRDGIIGSMTTAAREGYSAQAGGAFITGMAPKQSNFNVDKLLTDANHADQTNAIAKERTAQADVKSGITYVNQFAANKGSEDSTISSEIHTWLSDHQGIPAKDKADFINGIQPALTRLSTDITKPGADPNATKAILSDVSQSAELVGPDGLKGLVTPFAKALGKDGSNVTGVSDTLKSFAANGSGTTFGAQLASQLSAKGQSSQAQQLGADISSGVKDGVNDLWTQYQATFDSKGVKAGDKAKFEELGTKLAGDLPGLAQVYAQGKPPDSAPAGVKDLYNTASTMMSTSTITDIAATTGGQKVLIDSLANDLPGAHDPLADHVRYWAGKQPLGVKDYQHLDAADLKTLLSQKKDQVTAAVGSDPSAKPNGTVSADGQIATSQFNALAAKVNGGSVTQAQLQQLADYAKRIEAGGGKLPDVSWLAQVQKTNPNLTLPFPLSDIFVPTGQDPEKFGNTVVTDLSQSVDVTKFVKPDGSVDKKGYQEAIAAVVQKLAAQSDTLGAVAKYHLGFTSEAQVDAYLNGLRSQLIASAK
jgi:hypothetical protein